MPTLAPCSRTRCVARDPRTGRDSSSARNWVTIYTGHVASRHQFLCSGQIRGGTYDRRGSGPTVRRDRATGVEVALGRRLPRRCRSTRRMPASTNSSNGVQLVEWGCHDRHAETLVDPAGMLDEFNATVRPHPSGARTPVPAPSRRATSSHRAGEHRTSPRTRRCSTRCSQGARRKTARSAICSTKATGTSSSRSSVRRTAPVTSSGSVHDEHHPWHDPRSARALGGRSAARGVRRARRGIGEPRSSTRATDATVYVHLLARDAGALRRHGSCSTRSCGGSTSTRPAPPPRIASRARSTSRPNTLPATARRHGVLVVHRAAAPARGAGPARTDFDGDIPSGSAYAGGGCSPTTPVYGSVRLNLDGREPNGRITKVATASTADWLADRLLELVNVDTGAAAVARRRLHRRPVRTHARRRPRRSHHRMEPHRAHRDRVVARDRGRARPVRPVADRRPSSAAGCCSPGRGHRTRSPARGRCRSSTSRRRSRRRSASPHRPSTASRAPICCPRGPTAELGRAPVEPRSSVRC